MKSSVLMNRNSVTGVDFVLDNLRATTGLARVELISLLQFLLTPMCIDGREFFLSNQLTKRASFPRI